MEQVRKHVDPVLAVTQQLYALCGEERANGRLCARLAKRVKALECVLTALKAQDLGSDPEVLQQCMEELMVTLESAQELVKKYTSTSFVIRIIKGYNFWQEFKMLNKELDHTFQVLSLALHIDQQESLLKNILYCFCCTARPRYLLLNASPQYPDQ
ncbi:hypothetical protein AAFF_G00330600 [Aldrovandia affinis]|uniref:Mixed lineage kinase domain-containing protein n=1 Tax=Aldrovandia affinis TaxID=143900 RepID=A0AAD7R6H5_9TELE|nr:hypothetical protein AAFF_G00330600 [Aldrovandia affinis]